MHPTKPGTPTRPPGRWSLRAPVPGPALAAIALTAVACESVDGPTDPSDVPSAPTPRSAVVPENADLVSVSHGPTTVTFWPWTARGPDTDAISDPINLIFVGKADPREIRAALMALDGNRPPFPAVFPFNCMWKDAMGRPQATFGDEDGWTGSAVQLECGEFDPVRFHLRIFDLGPWTVANAHLDLLIPGTSEHQVIAWEAAEQFVAFDVVRTGLLGAPPAGTGPINAAPDWREIPAVIYDGIPAGLKMFIGGPPAAMGAPVPIGTDGRATIFTLAGAEPRAHGQISRALTIHLDQIVPRPFCSTGPGDFVRLKGPVELSLSVSDLRSGNYGSRFRAAGRITVTPADPLTGEQTGESLVGQVQEHHIARINASGTFVESTVVQLQLPPGAESGGRLKIQWITGIGGTPHLTVTEDC